MMSNKAKQYNNFIQCGFEQLLKYGYGDMTIAKIARLAGVQRSTFYWYFESKRHFALETLKSHSSQIKRPVSSISEADSGVSSLFTLPYAFSQIDYQDKSIRNAIKNYCENYVRNREHYDIDKFKHLQITNLAANIAITFGAVPLLHKLYGIKSI